MNVLEGKITNITTEGDLSLVRISLGQADFSSIVIDTPETAQHLFLGNLVKVIFKETEVILGVGQNQGVSLQNRIEGDVTSIEEGKLLSRIKLRTAHGEIISIVTSNAVRALNLTKGDVICAMIKTNEIMLSE